MQDQIIMDTTLSLTKNMCDLLMHGSIESQEGKINKTFKDALDKFLELQKSIYTEMQNAGLYKVEQVNASSIKKTMNKYQSKMD